MCFLRDCSLISIYCHRYYFAWKGKKVPSLLIYIPLNKSNCEILFEVSRHFFCFKSFWGDLEAKQDLGLKKKVEKISSALSVNKRKHGEKGERKLDNCYSGKSGLFRIIGGRETVDKDSLIKVCRKEPVKNIFKTKTEQPYDFECFEKILNQVFRIQICLIFDVLNQANQPPSWLSYCNSFLTDLSAPTQAFLSGPFKRQIMSAFAQTPPMDSHLAQSKSPSPGTSVQSHFWSRSIWLYPLLPSHFMQSTPALLAFLSLQYTRHTSQGPDTWLFLLPGKLSTQVPT